MEKEVVRIEEEIARYRVEYGLVQEVPCSRSRNKELRQLVKSGQPLPEGIREYRSETDEPLGEYCEVYTPELTHPQVMEYLTYKKLGLLRTIRNCVVFFTVLTVIGLVLSFLTGVSAFG